MKQIEIDFEVWKSLTSKLEHENQSYNDVLRSMLGFPTSTDMLVQAIQKYASRNLQLPNDTELRATYKGSVYRAKIQDGKWQDEQGSVHSSPSAAARYITGTNVNGLRFWEGRLPGHTTWVQLDSIGLFQ